MEEATVLVRSFIFHEQFRLHIKQSQNESRSEEESRIIQAKFVVSFSCVFHSDYKVPSRFLDKRTILEI